MGTPEARIGIAGHAGIGHTLCPGGLIQDDSLGFSVAAALIRDALQADTRIASAFADPDSNVIRVTTVDGGTAEASPRCGITPSEARLIAGVAGRDALLCQTVAVEALGRVYGQGVLETSASLQSALANAVIDTFRRKAPGWFHATAEDLPTNDGLMGGLSAEFNGVSAAVLAIVNGSSSGIGPNEDLEGSVALGSKRVLMERLGMVRRPTIVLEGKAYSPALSSGLKETTFLVRVQKDLDNIVVAEALRDAAGELGYPVIYLDDAFPRNEGVLRRKTVDVAERIAAAAARLGQAERGTDKVLASAELARLAGQEVGGVSFMTDRLHDAVRQCGLMPGTSAVLSMLVTREYLAHWKMPVLEPQDIDRMKAIVLGALPRIASRFDEAYGIVDRLYEDLSRLEPLVRSVDSVQG